MVAPKFKGSEYLRQFVLYLDVLHNFLSLHSKIVIHRFVILLNTSFSSWWSVVTRHVKNNVNDQVKNKENVSSHHSIKLRTKKTLYPVVRSNKEQGKFIIPCFKSVIISIIAFFDLRNL
jgi:hypothetical protein